ncbi:DUF6262 family protein [Streptomyces anthocyanicus]|uniref:DUF6262 family protein n=1 Tax=Streptomyces anthocyanicus TaxID=68174 RepID=UPI002E34C0DF|nr:DUF6262 family protein [Streptomyces anthocyanicus]
MTNPMASGRQADADRRRQRVLKVIDSVRKSGASISVSGIARLAGVDRTYLYRHRELLALVHAVELEPTGPQSSGVTRASLQTDLAHSQDRNSRLEAEVQRLRRRLSEALGEQVWQESGLGSPVDIDTLERTITRLEQHNIELKSTAEELQAELDAARAANRDLTRALNQQR